MKKLVHYYPGICLFLRVDRKLLFCLMMFLTGANLSAQIGGYALNFDGTNDYVEIPHKPRFDFTTGTIEAWIAPGASNQSKCFLSMRNTNIVMRWSAHVNQSNGTIGIAWSNNYSPVSVGTITPGTWMHVAIQLGTTTCHVYVNGVYKGSTTNGMTTSYTGIPLRIGIPNSTYTSEYFLGRIDEVRMWDVTRTEAEIKANMYKEIGTNAGLVAYYKMSEGTGTSLSDNSGNGNTGTLTNGPVWKNSGCFAGPRQTLDFDGTDDYVNISNGVVLGNTFTQEIWIYPTDATETYRGLIGKQSVVSSAQRPPCLYQYGLKVHFGFGNGTWLPDLTPDVLTINKWNHLAASFDGTTYRIYVDGVLVYTSGVASGQTPNEVGQDELGRGEIANFKGKMDEVRIWTDVRTEAEIRDNMMRTLDCYETGLAAYYRMDQYDATTLYNMASGSYNGTLTNMDAATDWVASSAFNTWIGSESSAWSLAGNWGSSTIPGATSNVGLYKWNELSFENTISGSPTINHLLLSSSSNPVLGSGITVNGNLNLECDFDLNGQVITLGSTGFLSEGNYRLYGTSGSITTSRSLSNITALNVGGLGAILTSAANLGSTTLTRTHASQANLTYGSSVLRSYDITPTNNTGLNATLVYQYRDTELNNITELALALYSSSDGGSTFTRRGGTLNTTDNTLTLTALGGFSKWTAGKDCVNPTNGGTIAEAQTICYGTSPAAFSSTALPSGEIGTLEYQWQINTSTQTATWVNVGNVTTTATYQHPTALTQTTWFRRLARVGCATGTFETNSVSSNEVGIIVNPLPTPTLFAAGATTFCQGGSVVLNVSGNALRFGLNSSVEIADNASLRFTSAQSYTVMAWVYVESNTNTWRGIVTKSGYEGDHYGIWLDNNNKWVYGVFGPGNIVSSTAATTGWHHIAIVQTGGGSRQLFVNGVLSGTGTAQTSNGTGKLRFGQKGNTLEQFVGGILDEVSIFSTNLSLETINTWKNTSITNAHPNYANLVGYWKLDEGTGSATTADASGHGYTGTLVNSPVWVATSAPVNEFSSYLWSPGSTTTPTLTVTTSGTYTVKVTDANGCSKTTSGITVTVNPATAITSQSTGSQTQCLGGTFSPITVTATGTGTLTYQWYSRSTEGNTGGTTVGTNSNSYTPSAAVAGTLYYYCVVTGTCGTATSAVSGAFITLAAGGIITISNDASSSGGWSINGGVLTACADVIVNAAVINAALVSGNLTVQATNNININAAIAPALTQARTLTLKAGGNISMAASVSIVPSTNFALNTIFWSDSDATNGGSILLNNPTTITTKGGHLWIGGGSGVVDWNGLTVGNGYAQSTTGTAVTLNTATISTSGGDIQIKGESTSTNKNCYGIGITAGSMNSGSGNISLYGIGGLATVAEANCDGISVYGPITTTTGNITLTGSSTAQQWTEGIAISISNPNTISSTSGNISLITNIFWMETTSRISSSGTLTLKPLSDGSTIGIAGGAGTLNLPTAYFTTNFVDGFSGITIGSSTAGNIGIKAIPFNDPVTFNANGNLNLENNIDLNGQTITLGNEITLNEASGRFYGTTGDITTTRDLSNISSVNVAGLGATITTTADMGYTVITRGHTNQSWNGKNSVLRYYDISPSNNTGLNATMVFSYNDAELNSLTESKLFLYKSANGGSTYSCEGGTVNTSANTITLSGIGDFSRWMAAEILTLTWNGAGSDFNTAANWTPNATPSLIYNLTIPNLATDPIVNQAPATPAVCNDLAIASGAVLTIAPGKSLTVNGTLTNSADITGLVIQSNATGTGSLFHSTEDVLATVERWMTGDLWHLISPAATDGESVDDFVGKTQNTNLIARKDKNYALAPYNETTDEWDYYKTDDSDINSITFTPGKGYQVLRASAADGKT